MAIEEIADHYGCEVKWCPMLLGKSYFGPTSVMKMPAVPSEFAPLSQTRLPLSELNEFRSYM